MTISGFTMVKNAGKLNYPFEESLRSLLDLVDEMVIALGDCDSDDNTAQIIESINSSKIKVIHTKWDIGAYPFGSILAQQTDIAKEHCTGDWLFYLQADEVIHENDIKKIRSRCDELLDDEDVDGLLFKYIHFWGDYSHAFTSNHTWYRNEIRIIRNRPEIHSWKDAQSFRRIPNFSKEKYLAHQGTFKLKVARVDAHIYHYGWVRPPKLMGKKQSYFDGCYDNKNVVSDDLVVLSEMDFGALGVVPVFKGSHPYVMKDKIRSFNWADQLNYTSTHFGVSRKKKHARLKYRIITFIESMFFKEFGIFTFKNFILLKK